MKIDSPLLSGWVWKMAWRDSRSHRKKLLLFMASIILGTAALVSISSLGENLERAIEEQSKSLLGADMEIRSQQPFTPETIALFDSISTTRSSQVSFTSMILFPRTGGTRLVSVRAIDGDFPYYGKLETEPAAAGRQFRDGRNALVDDGLMIQFNASPGDSIKLGDTTFRIAGRLLKIPGESAAASLVGPRVYIPLAYLDETNLIQQGSLAAYREFFKLQPDQDAEAIVANLKSHLEANRLRAETVASRKEDLGQAMDNLYRFLSLVGFIALLLGSVGVGSAVHVYVKQKLAGIAILHCIGAETRQTFLIYLIQAAAMGLLGATIGALLGAAIQFILPGILGDFLPVAVDVKLSWLAIAKGLLIGLGLALLFALLPLLTVRRVSPLHALRSAVEDAGSGRRDPLRWLVYAGIVLFITLFSLSQSANLAAGFGFVGALAAAFGLLALVARGLMWLVRRYFPGSWKYVWRQGLANLYRPNNQTLMMMVSLGLGTFLITTLYLTQNILLEEVSVTGMGDQPNMVFFDIQSDQREAMAELVRDAGLPVIQQVPIVTMRISQLQGRTLTELYADSTERLPRWALRREYRSSYRDSLTDSEILVAGTFRERVVSPDDTVYVSLAQDIAEDLRVGLGDEIVFDVQGVPMTTYVGSIREVNWRRVQPNFFVVFPVGVLEDAPQFHVLVTRTPSREASAAVQQAAVQRFPNVSAIDLTLILDTVDAILAKVAFVIRFMALFSIFTGLTVLVGAVITSRYQRMQESVLLRTLGASRRQIVQIMLMEYLCLGGLAALTGLVLSLLSSWALAFFVFNVAYVPAGWPLVVAFVLVAGLTILLGLFNSRGVTDRPPLEILRTEV